MSLLCEETREEYRLNYKFTHAFILYCKLYHSKSVLTKYTNPAFCELYENKRSLDSNGKVVISNSVYLQENVPLTLH